MKTLTPKEVASVFKISPPLAPPVRETQPFGVNWISLYKKLGYAGHNGIDYGVRSGTPILAVCDGRITYAGDNPGFGITIELMGRQIGQVGDVKFKMRFVYGHLKDVKPIKAGDLVSTGDVIGHVDSTGLSTGDHLHFGAYPYYHAEGEVYVRDNGNGFGGAIDSEPLWVDPDWNIMPVSRRYGEARDLKREFLWRMRHGTWAYYKLRRLPTADEVNALVYGYWPIEAILDPAMATAWYACTKPAFDSGKCKSPYFAG